MLQTNQTGATIKKIGELVPFSHCFQRSRLYIFSREVSGTSYGNIVVHGSVSNLRFFQSDKFPTQPNAWPILE